MPDPLKELEEWLKKEENKAVAAYMKSSIEDGYWKGGSNAYSLVLAKIAEMRENKNV